MYKFPLFFLALLLCTIGCTNSNQDANTDDIKTDDMAQFTEDENFKKAHETPNQIDFNGKGKKLSFDTPDGKKGSAYAVLSDTPTKKFLFVIHEWWGLNDHIKQEADKWAEQLDNVSVLALDLYDGNVTADRDEAGKFMGATKQERLEAIIKGAMAYAGEGATFGTIGWCFGGGWSLRASILAGEQGKACVMYYGMPVKKAAELAPIQAPIQGHFAKNEQWINPDVVAKFEVLAKATGKTFEPYFYDADHAFANPSSERYKEAAAQEANARSLAFLKAKL